MVHYSLSITIKTAPNIIIPWIKQSRARAIIRTYFHPTRRTKERTISRPTRLYTRSLCGLCFEIWRHHVDAPPITLYALLQNHEWVRI